MGNILGTVKRNGNIENEGNSYGAMSLSVPESSLDSTKREGNLAIMPLFASSQIELSSNDKLLSDMVRNDKLSIIYQANNECSIVKLS